MEVMLLMDVILLILKISFVFHWLNNNKDIVQMQHIHDEQVVEYLNIKSINTKIINIIVTY